MSTEDEIDPRAELIRRLLEYQKYKDRRPAASRLERAIRGPRCLFSRERRAAGLRMALRSLKEVSVFKLIDALQEDRSKRAQRRDCASRSTAERMTHPGPHAPGLVDMLRERRPLLEFDAAFRRAVSTVVRLGGDVPRAARDGEDATRKHLSDRP